MNTLETVQGVIQDKLQNLLFKIKLQYDKEIIAYLSGKMKINKITILIGDIVEVLLDPAGGKTTNRIIRRIL